MDVSRLTREHPLAEMILSYYEQICAGATLSQLCNLADKVKIATIGKVI